MRMITAADAPAAVGPYSQAVEANGCLWLSGQIPLDPKDGGLVGGGIQNQVEQVFDNIVAVLKEAGLTLENVVKTTCFLTNLDDFATFNNVYARRFGTHRPARSTIEVSALPKGALVEIEVIAVRD